MTWNESTHTCWDISRVPNLSVYDPTSDKTLFIAAHTPFALKVRSSGQNVGEGSIFAESDLVEMFYQDPNPNGASLWAVVGDPGTGKSQFIRLINLSRELAQPHHHIVYIPRDRTNLRGALERILDGLEGAEYDELRVELRGAVSQFTDPVEAERRFVTALGLELFSADRGIDAPEQQKMKVLLGFLTKVVSDIHFINKMLELGAPKRIIRQVLGQDEDSDDAEVGLEFTREEVDRLFDAGGLEPDNLAFEAREVWKRVVGPPNRVVVLELLNKYVAIAINNVFWSNGTSLVDLMNRLRLLLHKEGKELVLLIEDMSVLSGVQMELLEALITTVQDDEPVAPIRSIFAITHGFFNPLRDMVRQRISKVIEVQSLNGEGTPDSSLEFFARYLNAARLSESELNSLTIGQAVPSACDACPKKNDCHEAFGEVNGMGLFPYTASSFGLLKGTIEKKLQVPRVVVGTLFNDFLTTATENLKEGEFPSDRLLAGFKVPGVRNPSNIAQVNFQDRFEKEHERIVRFQRYWAIYPDIYDPRPDFLADAFQLPKPTSVGKPRVGPEPPPPPPPPPPSHDDPRERAFREWTTSPAGLERSVAQEARQCVFNAVCATLENNFGIKTGNSLIGDRRVGLGQLFRPESVVLPKAQGGGIGETVAYERFAIELKPENLSVIQDLVMGNYFDPSSLAATIAWIEAFTERVHNKYLERYGDLTFECTSVIVSSRLQSTNGTSNIGLQTFLGEIVIPEQLDVGRTEKWRQHVDQLLERRKSAIVKLDDVLGMGKQGGGTLSSRFKAYISSNNVIESVLNEETELENLARVEVAKDNDIRSSLRDLLGASTIGEVLPLIRSEINRLDSILSGQVAKASEIQEITQTIEVLNHFSQLDLKEVDTTSSLDDLLQSLSSVRRSDLQKIRSMIEELIKALDNLTIKANVFAQNRGYPQNLLSHVEQQFENFGFRKGS